MIVQNEKTLSEASNRLQRVQSHDDFKADFRAREVSAKFICICFFDQAWGMICMQ